MDLENKDICHKCGGRCCKKSGCDYFVSDFDIINKESITRVLETGNVSITSALFFSYLKDGRKVITPFLYLRARNIDRDVVDLCSLKKQCKMLKSDGCSYSFEERPGGGVNLIPLPEFKCKPNINPVEEMKKWEPYQNLLSKLVKRFSGYSVEQKLRIDIENTFVDIINENFDGVDLLEITDMFSCINDIIECFPDEFENAKNRTGLESENIKGLKLSIK